MKLLSVLLLSPPFGGSGGGPTPTTPPSLIKALDQYWTDAGLTSEIGPLCIEGAPSSSALPFVVVDGLREVLPGETPDDRPVEVYMTVYAKTAAAANAGGKLIEDHLGDPAVVPAVIEREQLAWAAGYEKFAERQESRAELLPSLYMASRPFRYYIHYRFWISGRW